ncbi:CCT motif family protein [Zea mays]|uniref:CCT motif family protein n=2 Tax=Zea mays TaxID=4577 RepID=K7VNP3_MAIZE|nr:CCT motif family protein [Zea mays]|eukprot:XP_008654940.1 CCT isoform X2 [Zea mays]
MFRRSSPSPSYSDALMHNHAASFSAPLPVTVPPPRGAAAGGYLDGNVGAFSSPPSSYYNYNNIQRSVSSHSLPMRLQPGDVSLGGRGLYSPSSPSAHQLTPTLPPLSSSPSSSSGELFEFTSPCPVRRVFSTGDLQGMNGSSPPRPVLSADACGHEGGGTFSQKVVRYSAVERKERIERYRVKRHQRNFNKKITYACRKTLADSRPRVKGRFARNGEAEADADDRETSDNSYEYGRSHNELGNGSAYSTTGSCYDGDNGEWWWRAPGASAAGDDDAQRQVRFDDDDDELWATLGDMMSMHLVS